MDIKNAVADARNERLSHPTYMLYLIATPIGNLADITFRAVETLKLCDYILCEDTRHSRHLLNHYEIKTPLKSFHKFNEASREKAILEDLQEGLDIGLISDAGMPAICDPGAKLVQACQIQKIDVTVIPGPSAVVTSLSLSGLQNDRFQFVGFLPKTQKDLAKIFEEILEYPGTTICYETPQRLLKTLSFLTEIESTRRVAIARELTKRHEEFKMGTAQELFTYYSAHPPRGEIVLLIDRPEKKEITLSEEEIITLVKTLMDSREISISEAVRQIAKKTGYSRRKIYQVIHLRG